MLSLDGITIGKARIALLRKILYNSRSNDLLFCIHMKDSVAEKLLEITRQGYVEVSSAFSATRRFSWDDCTPLQWIVKDSMNVLDVGCGNGRMADFLKNRDIHYVGIDLNQHFIQIALEKYGGSSEFYQGDIVALDDIPELKGRTFDAIFSIAVLHHLPSEKMRTKVFALMFQLLKPGGMLFLTNWNLWRPTLKGKSVWKYALERSLLAPDSYGRTFGIDYHDLSWRDLLTTWKSGAISTPLYYYSFRCRELARLCTLAGFDVVDCYYSKKGARAHWWNASNICVIARKIK